MNEINNKEEQEAKEKEAKIDKNIIKEEESNKIIEALNQKLVDYTDLLKRTQADFINYKSRISKETQDIVFLNTKEIALEMISFKELLLLSIKNEQSEETKKVLMLLLDKIDNSISRFGIEKIKLIDNNPDYNLCECVSVINTKNKDENNKIIEVLEEGYLYNNKIIKPVKVIISRLEE